MPCIKALFLASLHFATNLIPTTTTVSTAPLPDYTRLQYTELPPIDDLNQVLESIPSTVLHEALHSSLPNFADGMFEHDGSAVAEVYRTNQPLATRLLAAARYDLLRRQNGNLTATNPPPPAVIVPVTVTSTDSSGSTATSVVTALSEATVSLSSVVVTTDSKGKTTLLTTTVPAAVVTDTNGQVTTSPVPTINSEGVAVLTSVDASGSTFVTTITPTGGVVSSIVLQTTTLPDGSRSTYTSFAVVTPTGASAPKLQGNASSFKPKVVTISGLFVAMVAFGALLL